ncbi:MAG TPA: T9SS type A sorting domain-containing protein [Chitinophagales bacterium]|nr:T9SS type A sorting domain-containing protein [Chitinophagales bacterium]
MKSRFTFVFLLITAVVPLSVSQTFTGSLTHGGLTRTYRVHLPPGFSASMKLPLVLNLHGRGSNGQQQEAYTGFNSVADTANAVVAYPDASTVQGAVQWNVFGLSSTPDDVGFISALIDTLHARYNIDLSRVYATGLSSGGYMSYKLACALNCRIAAIAPVAGLLVEHPLAPCNLSRPLAVFHMHGTADGVVPYSGVAGTISSWRSKIGCPGTPTVTNLPDNDPADGCTVIDSSYRPCNNSTEIVLYAIIGGGHTWPDAVIDIGVTNHDFPANSTIWNFLKKYTIPQAAISFTGLAASYCLNTNPFPVTLTGNPSGGTFSGSGMSGNVFSPTTAGPGIHTITYTISSSGCTYSTSRTVEVASGTAVSVNASGPTTFCQGDSVILTASDGSNWQWNSGATTQTITVTSSGSYLVTVTNPGGCTGSGVSPIVNVTVNPNPVASISPAAAAICNGESVTLTATGGGSLHWSIGIDDASITVYPSATTTYSVTVTDSNGCTDDASRAVTVHPAPAASVSPPSATIYSGDSITLTASGGVAYSWSAGDATAAITVTPAATTTYSATVTDTNGCTASASATVTVLPTGINNPESLLAFSVYPNPSSGILNIEFERENPFSVKIEIYSLSGKKIFEKTAMTYDSAGNFQVFLDAPAGIYFVKLQRDEGVAIRKIGLAETFQR